MPLALSSDTQQIMTMAVSQLAQVQKALSSVIFGQESVIERTLITLLAGGHGLLVGVPGLAKTLLVETTGQVLGLEARRIQFTPDLMPSDILGSEVLDEAPNGQRSFRFIKGPVFAQLLMADEINRASPRTQSALLQAMQEKHVSIAGVRHDLPRPFHVLATQNPLEQEGTYPLPEAQLDRFLMQIDVDYPDFAAEKRMLLHTSTHQAPPHNPALLTGEQLMQLQSLTQQMPIGENVLEAILRLVRAARPQETTGNSSLLLWGAGPRASQALMLASKARALLQGRFAPTLEDVAHLADPVLKHRLALSYGARAQGLTPSTFIAQLVEDHLV